VPPGDDEPPVRPYEPNRGPMPWRRPAAGDARVADDRARTRARLGSVIVLLVALSIFLVIALVVLR
jgi:hypothetical protein